MRPCLSHLNSEVARRAKGKITIISREYVAHRSLARAQLGKFQRWKKPSKVRKICQISSLFLRGRRSEAKQVKRTEVANNRSKHKLYAHLLRRLTLLSVEEL